MHMPLGLLCRGGVPWNEFELVPPLENSIVLITITYLRMAHGLGESMTVNQKTLWLLSICKMKSLFWVGIQVENMLQ